MNNIDPVDGKMTGVATFAATAIETVNTTTIDNFSMLYQNALGATSKADENIILE